MNTAEQVHQWSDHYPIIYDELHYNPFIAAARRGNVDALRRVTEWKNPGRGNPPTAMRLSQSKEVAFQKFIARLNHYLGPEGSATLRDDFPASSPVYAIFWHHVLFCSPIFDVHTNRAFHHFTQGRILIGRAAAVHGGGHWELYDRYTTWFSHTLVILQAQDPAITERQFDRALMQWGIAHKG